jgi:rfaE bifunctional protein kinase chain/domain
MLTTAKFVVVGDLILDRFYYGDAVRISPEAPALVLDVKEEVHSAGGAFNVYSHLKSLGGNALFITVTGEDIETIIGDYRELSEGGRALTILQDPMRITSLKTRLIAHYKLSYLARFDKERVQPINADYRKRIIDFVGRRARVGDSVLVIDYNKGIVDAELSKELIRLCKRRGAKVYVDSKKDDISQFTGAFLLKPNKFEFHKIKLRYQLDGMDDVSACRVLLERFDLQHIVITMGAQGMMAVERDGSVISVPGRRVSIRELSGAGDSVLAVLATSLGEGRSMRAALKSANRVASAFISTGVAYRALREDM